MGMNFQVVHFHIHYPNQFLLYAIKGSGLLMDMLRNGKTSGTRISIIGMELLKRRKSKLHDCTNEGGIFDTIVLEKHIDVQGCRAPYQTQETDRFPLCNSKQKISKSLYSLDEARSKYYPKACERISNLNYYVKSLASKEKWHITILFPEEIKIITQSKEVDVHALVGNIGGYIGLFLGKKLLNTYCNNSYSFLHFDIFNIWKIISI